MTSYKKRREMQGKGGRIISKKIPTISGEYFLLLISYHPLLYLEVVIMSANFGSSLVEMAGTAPASEKVSTLLLLSVVIFGYGRIREKRQTLFERNDSYTLFPTDHLPPEKRDLWSTIGSYKHRIKKFVAGHLALILEEEATASSD